MLALYERLSDESIYLRFFSPVPRPTAVQLERLTNDRLRRPHGARRASSATRSSRSRATTAAAPARPRSRSRSTTTSRAAGSARSCSSTSRSSRAGNGIHTFVADTLPDNHEDAQRLRRRRLGERAPLRPGHRARPVQHRRRPRRRSTRSRRANARPRRASIARLLAPRSIAVIGASRHPGTIGHELFRNLLAYGFEGPVYPVNPSSTSVAGVRAYPTRARRSRRGRPRGRRRARGRGARRRARVRGEAACTGWSSSPPGFAEVGADGQGGRARAGRDRRVATACASSGRTASGVVNTAPGVRMNATFAPGPPGRRQRRVPVAVGRARDRADEPGRRASASASPSSSRSATRPTSAATTCCSTGPTTRTPT